MTLQSSINRSGYVGTSNQVTTAIRASDYTEQSANAQRSIASASANDSAAGTGARKVRIRYLDSTLTALKEEVVTLNGATPVNTVATDICFIESMVIEDVGAVGGNVGNITLFVGLAGAGGAIGVILAGDNQTNWCQHYVAQGYTAYVTVIQADTKGASSGLVSIRATPLTAPAKAELTIAVQLRVPAGDESALGFSDVPLAVVGPARITLYVKQDAPGGVNTWYAGFGYYEN
jgi:hypothetical protein